MTNTTKKHNAHQDIDMQLNRLTEILDALHNKADSNLGTNNVVTKRALKAVLYFHALKCDLEALKNGQGV